MADKLENLKKFEKGESGNPNGRPKGAKSLSTILRDMLDESIDVKEGDKVIKKNFADVIVRKLIQKANAGEIKAITEIFDRVEGKSKQAVDVTTKGESINKITVEIITKPQE